MRMVIVILGLLSCSVNLIAQTYSKKVNAANGHFIGFLEYRPADYSSDYKHPLIIFLHGIGETGNGTTELDQIYCCGIPSYIKRGHDMKFSWNGKKESFVVLMPQLATKYIEWQSYYVNTLIDYAVKNLNIDPDRIFLTGLSLGGGGTWAYASETQPNAAQLAGIVPVVGPCMMTNGCNIARAKLPVLAVHSKNDKTVSPTCTTDAIASINGCDASAVPNLIMYPDGGHAVWLKRAFSTDHSYQNPNIYEWMLAQNRKLQPNRKPRADAGDDIIVNSSDMIVKLSGSGSTDEDGKITRYSWRKLGGPGSGIINTPSSASTTLDGPNVVGKYYYELKVVDDRAEWSRDTVAIIVNVAIPLNEPPVADAGENAIVVLPGGSVIVNGDGSHDDDGNITDYEWNYLSGPDGAIIVDKKSARTEISGLVKGIYEFELRVMDDKGKTGADTIKVTVTDDDVSTDGNKAPVALAGNDTTINSIAEFFVLDGSNSFDPDGMIKKYVWRRLSGNGVNIETADKPVTKVSGAKEGVYRFELIVTDNQQRNGKDTIQVNFGKTDAAADVIVFPNPATNTVRVSLFSEERGLINVTIYNTDGKKVMQRSVIKNQADLFTEIFVSHLQTGIYFVALNGKDTRQVKKFVKTR